MTKRIKRKIHKKVEYLNEAAIEIDRAIKKIKRAYPKDKDVDVLTWRIQKTVGELHKCIIRKLQKQVDEESFNDAIKGFSLKFKGKKDRRKKPPTKKKKRRKE